MTVNQLSIFIENRSGTLIKVLQILKQANIQIVASTIADTAEYGIYRLICSEPIRAYEELKKCDDALMAKIGQKATCIRPPTGQGLAQDADAFIHFHLFQDPNILKGPGRDRRAAEPRPQPEQRQTCYA